MKKLIVTLLSVLFLVSGCNKEEVIVYDGTFKDYVDSLYVEIKGTTDIGINLSFNNPEAFGIEPEPYRLGFSTQEEYDESNEEINTMIKTLRSFKDDDLSDQEILDRDALIANLSLYVGSHQFYEFEEGDALSSSRSYIMIIPSYLDMYVFNNERDIDYYFNFVETLNEDIQKYVELEKTRQANSTGLSQKELDAIIKAARSTATAANSDAYFLNRSFASQIATVDFLDQTQKDEYTVKHQALMKQSFSSAYETLASSLEELEGGAVTGLANKTNGKAYYEYLLKKNTGSSYSVKELSSLLDSRKQEVLYRIITALSNGEYSDTIEEDIQTGTLFDGMYADAYKLLDDMTELMKQDFPATTTPTYEIRTVDASLRASASPAFYFTPKVDATEANTQYIYVNGDFDVRQFTTYIHEGIPGHMYQFNYFKQSGEHQIRSLLSASSNAEGWANYTENYAVRYVLGDEMGALYADYMELLNIMYVQLDIGINYEGWSKQETLDFLIESGWYAENTPLSKIDPLYLAFVEIPCVYPMYYVTSMYIRILSEKAQTAWGSDYSDYAFHEAFLELGSTSFDMIEKHLKLSIMK